jgi:hypothetical protein
MSRMAAGGMSASLPASLAAETRRVAAGAASTLAVVKTMFWLYLVLVWTGIVYFAAIGLTHH